MLGKNFKRGHFEIQSNFNGSNIFGTIKNVRDIGSSSHWGLTMVPGQEANSDNLGILFYFRHNNCMLSVLIRIASMRYVAILMSTHNIQFHDKIRKFPKIFVFLSQWKHFVGTLKWVRISHGKRAIGVRAVEIRLYFLIVKETICMKCRVLFVSFVYCSSANKWVLDSSWSYNKLEMSRAQYFLQVCTLWKHAYSSI